MKKLLCLTLPLLFLIGCGSSDDSGTVSAGSIPNVSGNAAIQTAYENCVQDMRKDLREDNPSTPNDIMQSLYEGANQACNSAVVITCNRGLDDSSCKMVLDMYK